MTQSFGRSALLMVAGSGVAQAVTLLVMPVLTRLYEPEAIAVYALSVSLGASLVVLGTLRLDLALVLPRREDLAWRLAGLVFYQSLALGCVVVAVAVTAGEQLTRLLVPGLYSPVWLYFLGAAVVAGSLIQVGIGLATRAGRFGVVVTANLTLSVSFAVVAVISGLSGAHDSAVALSRMGGQWLAALAFVVLGCMHVRRVVRPPSLAGMGQSWCANRQFLMYNTPYSLVGSVARDAPLYVLAVLAGPLATAAYALARSVTLAPATLLSSAVSSVFFREAARSFGSPALERLARSLTAVGLLVTAPVFAFITVEGPNVFVRIFGADWRMAGQFAQLLAVPLWLALQTGWPERLFEVAGRQRVSFSIQMGFDALNALLAIVAFAVTASPLLTVSAYATGYTCYQATYLFAVYRVAKFQLRPLTVLLARALGAFGVSVALIAGARAVLGRSEGWDLAVTISIAAVLALALAAACKGSLARVRQGTGSNDDNRATEGQL